MSAKLTKPQQDRRLAVLRDVQRSGGVDSWDHLSSHGHNYMTVSACCLRGDLIRSAYRFALTDTGRAAIAKASPSPSKGETE